jgi:hypothetical protein
MSSPAPVRTSWKARSWPPNFDATDGLNVSALTVDPVPAANDGSPTATTEPGSCFGGPHETVVDATPTVGNVTALAVPGCCSTLTGSSGVGAGTAAASGGADGGASACTSTACACAATGNPNATSANNTTTTADRRDTRPHITDSPTTH